MRAYMRTRGSGTLTGALYLPLSGYVYILVPLVDESATDVVIGDHDSHA